MRIATTNKLAHLQIEYQTLLNQTSMLQTQYNSDYAQCCQLIAYTRSNPGDRRCIAEAKKQSQRCRSLQSNINRNHARLRSLEGQIQREQYRLMCGRTR